MLEFHDPIPELAGQICLQFLSQEYWCGGDRVSPANALLLHLQDGGWHRFFIDAGVVFWRSQSDQPLLPPSVGDHMYTLADLGERHRITGHTLLAVRATDLPGGGEIRLEFSDAPSVILRDQQDKTELEISTDVTSTA